MEIPTTRSRKDDAIEVTKINVFRVPDLCIFFLTELRFFCGVLGGGLWSSGVGR